VTRSAAAKRPISRMRQPPNRERGRRLRFSCLCCALLPSARMVAASGPASALRQSDGRMLLENCCLAQVCPGCAVLPAACSRPGVQNAAVNQPAATAERRAARLSRRFGSRAIRLRRFLGMHWNRPARFKCPSTSPFFKVHCLHI
jgi:hypothetical protein